MTTPEPMRLDLRSEPDADLGTVVAHVARGGLLAYPTETVYGLGGACTEEAVSAVHRLKRRGSDKPLIVLVDSTDSVSDLVWTDDAREFARVFWPGAVTLVLEDPDRIFPAGIRSPEGTVAVRRSPEPVVARLLNVLGGPITSTSLNEPGTPPARSGEEALEVARRMGGTEIFVLDAGTLPPSGPSTIVDCTGKWPAVLREGTVPLGRLRCVVPETHGE